MWRRFYSIDLLAFVAAAGVQSATAAFSVTVSPEYDSLSNANSVDSVAGLGSVDLTPASSHLASYYSIFSSAYAANMGGVINFDNIAMSSADRIDTTLSVSYGVDSVLTITTSPNYGEYQFQTAAVVGTPISGATYLRAKIGSVSGGSGFHTFNFSNALSHLAFTALNRTDMSRSITATVTYDDDTTGTLSDTVAGSPSPSDDTFFGFTAPDGRTIKRLVISGGSGNFFAIDDFAFVVAIPEPSIILTGGLAGLVLLARRRRQPPMSEARPDRLVVS
jgi:hypothetical protein